MNNLPLKPRSFLVAVEMLTPDPLMESTKVICGDQNRFGLVLLHDIFRRGLAERGLYIEGTAVGWLGCGACLFYVKNKEEACAVLKEMIPSIPMIPGTLIVAHWDEREDIYRSVSQPDQPSMLSIPGCGSGALLMADSERWDEQVKAALIRDAEWVKGKGNG